VLLTLQADIAQNYFALRSLDAERDVLRRAIGIRRQALDLIRVRYEGGIGTELDVTRAQTEVARRNPNDRRQQTPRRDRARHCGPDRQTARRFRARREPLNLAPPAIPAGLPSELLVRRPDVAQAERLLAARNAEIGVAQAAYFPSIRLTGALGFDSAELGDLLKSGSGAGSLGVGLSLPVFDGDASRATWSVQSCLRGEPGAVPQPRAQRIRGRGRRVSGLRILRSKPERRHVHGLGAADGGDLRNTIQSRPGDFPGFVDAERTRLPRSSSPRRSTVSAWSRASA